MDTFMRLGTNWDFETIWGIGLLHETPSYIPTLPYFLAGLVLATSPPVIREVSSHDRSIRGLGHSADAMISVELPNGVLLETTTAENLEWSVDIPAGVDLSPGDVITVTQQETGFAMSTEAEIIVEGPYEQQPE